MDRSRLLGVLYASIVFIACSEAHASYATYTSQSDFLAGLTGTAMTLDFESVTAPYIINSGDTLGGITFSYSIGPPPIDLIVTNDFLTTSGTKYLGVDDSGNYNLLIAGDTFTMTFSAQISALGMYFVSGDPLFANDIELVTSIGTAYNSDSINVMLSDGGLAYYIGMVSDTPFSSASISFNASAIGTFLYSVDDITTSTVPIPAAILLFLSGLIALLKTSWTRKPI